MKTLSSYLIKEFILNLLLTLVIYLFVLVVAKVFKELLTVMISRHLGFGVLLGFAGCVMPYMLSFSMPLAVLTASVLTFSKLSAENELTAAAAGGVSLWWLAAPVVVVSACLSVVALASNAYLAPRGLVAAQALVRDSILDKLETDPAILFEPGKEVRDFPGRVVRVGGINPQTGRLTDLRLTVLDKNGRIHSVYWARAAEIKVQRPEKKIMVRLFKVEIAIHQPTLRPGVYAEEYSEVFDLKDYLGRAARQSRWADRTLWELYEIRDRMAASRENFRAITFEAHLRASYAFACFAFAVAGVPLGIKTRRRETSMGILVSILVAAAYYSFVVLGQSFKDKVDLLPVVLLWTPNVLGEAFGLLLLWRASRL